MAELCQPHWQQGIERKAMSARRGNGIRFEPTSEERVMVERLSGLMVSEEEIARDWIKPPISRPTLRKHFADELARGRNRTVVRLKSAAFRAAEAGSVRAQIWLLERFFWQLMPPMRPAPREEPSSWSSMPEGGVVRIYKLDDEKPPPV